MWRSVGGVWERIKELSPKVFNELHPGREAVSALQILAKTGSIAAAATQIASSFVYGAYEHVFGTRALVTSYRITPRGLVSEFVMSNPADGSSTIQSYTLLDLIKPSKDRLARSEPGYVPLPDDQIRAYTEIGDRFHRDPTLHAAIVDSRGHYIGSENNWLYIFVRNPKDPEEVKLVALKLPSDPRAADLVRDQYLKSFGLSRPESSGSNAPFAPMFMTDPAHKIDIRPFEQLQREINAKIQELTEELIQSADDADNPSFHGKIGAMMNRAGEYVRDALKEAEQNSRKAALALQQSAKYGRSGDASGGAASEVDDSVDTEAKAQSTNSQELADLNEQTDSTTLDDDEREEQDEQLATVNTEAEEEREVDDGGGDDEYEGVETRFDLDDDDDELVSGAVDSEQDADSDEDEGEEGFLTQTTDAALVESEENEEGVDTLQASADEDDPGALLLETDIGGDTELDESLRLRELIEELGGDVSLLNLSEDEFSSLGVLFGEGTIPALGELADYEELKLTAELAESAIADQAEIDDEERDAAEEEAQREGAFAAGEGVLDGSVHESSVASLGEDVVAGAEDQLEAVQELGAGLEQQSDAAGFGEEGTDQELFAAQQEGALFEETEARELWDSDSFESSIWGSEIDEDEAEQAASEARAARADRRRVAMKALNRLRYQAERAGVDLHLLMKQRRRRGLRRLWFEQLVFAIARELKFTHEQRMDLARELELSNHEFDDIRQAELAIRREAHARRLKSRRLPALELAPGAPQIKI